MMYKVGPLPSTMSKYDTLDNKPYKGEIYVGDINC